MLILEFTEEKGGRGFCVWWFFFLKASLVDARELDLASVILVILVI